MSRVPFELAFTSVSVGKSKIKQSDYLPSGKFRVVDQGKSENVGYSNKSDFVRSDGPYIVFGDHTREVKYVDYSFVVGADGVRLYKASAGFRPKFLYYFLKSITLPSDSYGRHSKYLKDLSVPKLNPDQQTRLEEKLTAQLAEVEKTKEAVEMQLKELAQFRLKIQEKALKLLEGIPRLPLEHFLEGIEAGKSIKTTELPAREDELGVLKVSAVSWDKFQPDEAKSIELGYEPKESHRVRKGDLIISRANTLELVGAVVLVTEDYPNRLLSDKTLRLVLKENLKIHPEYLLQILKLNEARAHIEDNATGTSESMRNISQKTINNIPIPDADSNKQKELIELFNYSNEHVAKAENSLINILKELKTLPQKILNEAFQTK